MLGKEGASWVSRRLEITVPRSVSEDVEQRASKIRDWVSDLMDRKDLLTHTHGDKFERW